MNNPIDKNTSQHYSASLRNKSVPAFSEPSYKIEVSLRDWSAKWMDLHLLKKPDLERFVKIIEYIQKGDRNHMIAFSKIKPTTNPGGLKRVEYKEKYPVYEMKVGHQARVFFNLIPRDIDGEKDKMFAHILWVDLAHKICE